MYYDKTYRGEIPPQKWDTPKHLRYKNGRLGGKDPAVIRLYTTPLPKGRHRDCPEQRYFEVSSAGLTQGMDRFLKQMAKEGATHEELEAAYHQYEGRV